MRALPAPILMIAPGTHYGAVLFDPDGNKLEIVVGAMH